MRGHVEILTRPRMTSCSQGRAWVKTDQLKKHSLKVSPFANKFTVIVLCMAGCSYSELVFLITTKPTCSSKTNNRSSSWLTDLLSFDLFAVILLSILSFRGRSPLLATELSHQHLCIKIFHKSKIYINFAF